MNNARPAFAACATLALVACSIGKPLPEPNTYAVQASVPDSVPSAASRSESLRIGSVRVAAAYAGTPLVYRTDEVRFISDPYSQFMAAQYVLIDETGVRPKAVLERTIAKRVDLPRASPDALVRGYGDALAESLGELSKDLQVVPKQAAR